MPKEEVVHLSVIDDDAGKYRLLQAEEMIAFLKKTKGRRKKKRSKKRKT